MTDGIHNIPAERWVLYALLMGDQPFMDAIPTLLPRHFYRSEHADIFDALRRAYDRTGTGGLLVVWDELREVCRPEEYDQTCMAAVDLLSTLYIELTAYHPICLSPTYLKTIARIVTDLYERRERLRGVQGAARRAWNDESQAGGVEI